METENNTSREPRAPAIVRDAELAERFAVLIARLTDDTRAFLCAWLGISATDVLTPACEILQNGTAYGQYHRRKPAGGWRRITEPAEPLKTIQRKLLHIAFASLPVHHASYAGIRSRSAPDAIRWHAEEGQAFFKVDLRDAYPSVGLDKLEPIVRPHLERYLADTASHLTADDHHALIAFCLACCITHGGLAQGSPVSLHLMNAARYPLDCAIAIALQREPGRYTYTAYVDDLLIARQDSGEIPQSVRTHILEMVESHNFPLNRSRRKRKIDYWPADGSARRPVLLGLVPHPDGRVTISARDRKRFRAALQQILLRDPQTDADRSMVAGITGYLHMVYGDERLPSEVRVLAERCRERFGRPDRAPGIGYPDIDRLLASRDEPPAEDDDDLEDVHMPTS